MHKQHPKFFKMFDGIVISGNCGYAKPERKMYLHILRTHKLNPRNCIFIDDQAENIATAKQVGIATIHCKKTQGMLHRKGPDYASVKKQFVAWEKSQRHDTRAAVANAVAA